MDYPQLNLNKVEGPKATIKTNHGDIKIQLFPEQAPMTVENFVRLAQKGYYDKTIFHRVISDFMIQGGDPEGNGTGGTSIWDHPFEDEFSQELFNLRGALSMAKLMAANFSLFKTKICLSAILNKWNQPVILRKLFMHTSRVVHLG